jgi:aryl-alcohol dehydrogenase-like predicted oxidoreductase
VADFLLEGPLEIVLAGTPGDDAYRRLAAVVRRRYLPNRVIAIALPDGGSPTALSEGKSPVGGKPTLYVCRNFVCQAPITDPRAAEEQLDQEVTERRKGRVRSLPAERLAGRASREGTERYASRFRASLGDAAYGPFGSTEWTVSRFGFGAYRVDDRSALHRAALEKALTSGVQLVDTSTNYADGHSEQLIGEVLARLTARGAIARDEIVVVTKAGYAQGQNLELAKAREASGEPFDEMVRVADGLWHSIHPTWLDEQISRSLERLQLETVDVLLLHNPEYFLSDAAERGSKPSDARHEFRRRLTEAFRHLEQEVARGRIAAYGVSSNSVVSPTDEPDATNLEHLLEAARAAGGDDHHFRVLQLPMNLLEPGALSEKNTGASGEATPLELARARRLAVLVNRPLNAIVDGRLIRLADPPEVPDGARLDESLAALRQLEQEFASKVAPALRLPPEASIRPADLFRWADELAQIAANVDAVEQWNEIENHALGPALAQRVTAMNRGLSGALRAQWAAWRDRYVPVFDAAAGAIRRKATDRSLARSRAVTAALDGVGFSAASAGQLSRRALVALKSVPGVSTVLVGMRAPDFEADALAVMGVPDAPNAEAAFSAAAAASIPGT